MTTGTENPASLLEGEDPEDLVAGLFRARALSLPVFNLFSKMRFFSSLVKGENGFTTSSAAAEGLFIEIGVPGIWMDVGPMNELQS